MLMMGLTHPFRGVVTIVGAVRMLVFWTHAIVDTGYCHTQLANELSSQLLFLGNAANAPAAWYPSVREVV